MHAPWTHTRTLTIAGLADDPDWVATSANLAAVAHTFSVPAVNGQVASAIQLAWTLTTATDVIVAPAGTYSYRLIELVDPDRAGGQVYAGVAVVGANISDLIHLADRPGAGATYALRVYTVAGLPVTATKANLWVKGAL